MSRSLVITADDFGYCRERNRGIVEAYEAGVVTRASLLVNASYAHEAVVIAAEHKIPFGLHLNLTEGLPISPPNEVRSLLTNAQFFRGKLGFRSSLTEGYIDLEEVLSRDSHSCRLTLNLDEIREASSVRIEIIAQIRRFKELTGHLPYFVDGHQHVHILSEVCNVFAEELEKTGIISTRLPMELGIEVCDWIPITRREFYKSVVKDARNASFVFRKHNLRFGSGFVGMATMGGDMTRQTLEEALYTAFSCPSPTSHHAGVQNPVLNCDNMQTVNSTSSSSPQPGAVLSLSNSRAALLGPRERANKGSGGGGGPVSTVLLGPSSVNIDCDTDLSVGSKDTVSMLPVIGPCSSRTMEVELMTHPGYPCLDGDGGCGEGPDDFASSSDRLHELNELKKPWFQAFIPANSIQLRHDFVSGRTQM